MDPFSISTFAIGTAGTCLKLIENVARFLHDVKDAPESISEFHRTTSVLYSALKNIASTLKQHRDQRPVEANHHKVILQILKSCDLTLNKLTKELPEVSENANSWRRARAALELSLNSNAVQHCMTNINTYTQVLQLSLISVGLGALWEIPQSQDRIEHEIRSLTDAIRSSNLPSPRNSTFCDKNSVDGNSDGDSDETLLEDQRILREIYDWRVSADDVAAAVSLHAADTSSQCFDAASPMAGYRGHCCKTPKMTVQRQK